jgi:hypothetical protein
VSGRIDPFEPLLEEASMIPTAADLTAVNVGVE